MPTIWQWKTATFSPLVMPHFEAVEVKKLSIDAIMVQTHMASSMADAQRLVKQGGVSFRKAGGCVTLDQEHTICICEGEGNPRDVKDCEFVLHKFKDPRDQVFTGHPVDIHCGSQGHPRMTKRLDGLRGFDTWVGAITIMIPTEGQKIEDWSEERCFEKHQIELRMQEHEKRGLPMNFIAAYCELEWERQHEQLFIWSEP